MQEQIRDWKNSEQRRSAYKDIEWSTILLIKIDNSINNI